VRKNFRVDLDSIAGKKISIVCAAFLFAIVTSLPQIYLNYSRGSHWNGSCAYLDTDELAYAAYANALIDGRPRRNDPFTGQDGYQVETLFSIQSLPAYAVALPARLLHLSVSTMFILLLPLATIAGCFGAWVIIMRLTNNPMLAVVGAIGVFSFGTAAAHSPIQLLSGVQTGYDFFPYLRRYIPALPFSLFLLLMLCIWRALMKHWTWSIAAAMIFICLVFSYFFLWTAAAAWLFTLILLWLICRKEWRKCAVVTLLFLAIASPALFIYVRLVMQRAHTLESGQLLEFTRRPDLLRAPELYGGMILIVLGYQLFRKNLFASDPRLLFTISLALAPFILFNQQVITERSLQPFHYEEFVANYWVVLAAFLTLGIWPTTIPRRINAYLFVGGLGLAVTLGIQAARHTKDSNVRFDEARAVALKFKDENLQGVVFATDFRMTNSLSTVTRNPVLWSRFLYTFSNINGAEQKRRYFLYLYFSGVDEKGYEQLLKTDFFAQWEVFGAARANPVLTADHVPVTDQEIAVATKEYGTFVNSFNRTEAINPQLSYAIVSRKTDLSNLDRWYVRENEQAVGNFLIFRLMLKN
jgi:hypothetical protein